MHIAAFAIDAPALEDCAVFERISCAQTGTSAVVPRPYPDFWPGHNRQFLHFCPTAVWDYDAEPVECNGMKTCRIGWCVERAASPGSRPGDWTSVWESLVGGAGASRFVVLTAVPESGRLSVLRFEVGKSPHETSVPCTLVAIAGLFPIQTAMRIVTRMFTEEFECAGTGWPSYAPVSDSAEQTDTRAEPAPQL